MLSFYTVFIVTLLFVKIKLGETVNRRPKRLRILLAVSNCRFFWEALRGYHQNMSDDNEAMALSASGPGSPALWRSRRQTCHRLAPPVLRMPPERLALFLDVDGTLAPIVAQPHLTRVPVHTRRILLNLQSRGVMLAALSGRPLSQVRRLLVPIELALGGSHGAQLSMPGRGHLTYLSPPPDGMLSELYAGISPLAGVWLERKPSAIAVHWRQAPQYRSAVELVVHEALQRAPGWQLMEGHCVHELRPRGRDKGKALRRLMQHADFAGRWPLAIGDDRTDEDAFAAALSMGGGAIRVGHTQESVAPWRLGSVHALAGWLQQQLNKFGPGMNRSCKDGEHERT